MSTMRTKLRELISLDTSKSAEAGIFKDLLATLHQQKGTDIDAREGQYPDAAKILLRFVLNEWNGTHYDGGRKALWYLTKMPPKEKQYPELDVKIIYHLYNKGRHLYLYSRTHPKGAKIDMQDPVQRAKFLDIRGWAEKNMPPVKRSVMEEGKPPVHRDVKRVKEQRF